MTASSISRVMTAGLGGPALVLLACAIGAGLPASGNAQNLIQNPGFEQFVKQSNLWDGVDSDGYLAGSTASLRAITASGSVSNVAMPLSVRVADLNADGLQDLVTADPEGYFRVYFNSGSPTAPAFTHGETFPLYLSRFGGTGRDPRQNLRFGPRIDLFDLRGQGTLDLVIGVYSGEILVVPNSGSRTAPEFRQPTDVDRAVVDTAPNGRLWGNLFAPVVFDMNGDRTPDLLIGEGSYSANAIHLLVNKGSGQSPRFTDEDRFFLAYGDGREHLVPALADFNGDGQIDVLVGDREGEVAVHLSPGSSWRPGTEFPFSSLISFGGSTSIGGAICPATGDLNGDGLVDLAIGKSNGRIGLALNKGTAKEPKFEKPVDIKGTPLHPALNHPRDWSFDFGETKGNVQGYVSCVDSTDDPQSAAPEGKRVLKVAYAPVGTRLVKFDSLIFPATGKLEDYFYDYFGWKTIDAGRRGFRGPGNLFVLSQDLRTKLKAGVTYELSFKARGNRVSNAEWTLAWAAKKTIVAGKKIIGERDSVKYEGGKGASEVKEDRGSFSPGTNWGEVTRKIKVSFSDRELKDVNPTNASFNIECIVAPGEGVLYLDDIKLVEAK